MLAHNFPPRCLPEFCLQIFTQCFGVDRFRIDCAILACSVSAAHSAWSLENFAMMMRQSLVIHVRGLGRFCVPNHGCLALATCLVLLQTSTMHQSRFICRSLARLCSMHEIVSIHASPLSYNGSYKHVNPSTDFLTWRMPVIFAS